MNKLENSINNQSLFIPKYQFESIEKNKIKSSDLKEFLTTEFWELNNNYYSTSKKHDKECEPMCNRSIGDIYSLCKYYFPDCTLLDVVRILYGKIYPFFKKNKETILEIRSDINRILVEREIKTDIDYCNIYDINLVVGNYLEDKKLEDFIHEFTVFNGRSDKIKTINCYDIYKRVYYLGHGKEIYYNYLFHKDEHDMDIIDYLLIIDQNKQS